MKRERKNLKFTVGNSNYDNDKETTFDYLCNKLKTHYVFLEFKNLDIDEIRKPYDLKISNSMSDEDYFDEISDFINEFKDGHSNIISPFARSSYYPEIVGENLDSYNPNYNRVLINKNYLNENSVYGKSLKNGIIERNGNKYGYIYYSSFMVGISYYEINTVLKRFRSEGVDGVILDIRNNGGGNLLNVVTLVSYFGGANPGSSKRVVRTWRRDSINSYTQIDELSMAPMVSVPFDVVAADNVYSGPVALLTNRGSYSASSFTATAFKCYDNVKQIGDDTGGGMGLPIGGYLPLQNWSYRFSSNIVMDARATSYKQDEYNYEDGVPADDEYKIDDDLTTTKIDEIIDEAISWIDTTDFSDIYTP